MAVTSARLSSVRWGDGRAVEGARLLSVYRSNAPIEGSNPSLSATVNSSRRGCTIACWKQDRAIILTASRAPVAQGIERWVADPKAAGSNPARRTTIERPPFSGRSFVFQQFVPICRIHLTEGPRLWYNPGRRGVRVVEGAALEKRCGDEPPRVRIPPSPPPGDLDAPVSWKGRIAWPSARDWKSRRR